MRDSIHLRGVHHHNLKNLDLDIPIGKLTVFTGVSGSGKSTLAFDVLYAEGQRRYIETFSPYARQFFDRMDKPQADQIENILPAIAIEQKNTIKTSRSTVGTLTEIVDYLKVLWPHVAVPFCPQCGKEIKAFPAHQIWEAFRAASPETEVCLIIFRVQLSEKISFQESLSWIQSLGYNRALIRGKVKRLEEIQKTPETPHLAELLIIQDRVRCTEKYQKRFTDSCEQAYRYGQGQLLVLDATNLDTAQAYPFSNKIECLECHISLPKPTPGLFSYNHPLGACPVCHGFGKTIGIDMNLVIPDTTKTLREGAIKPWQSGVSRESQMDMLRMAHKAKIPLDVPFRSLTAKQKRWVIEGDPDYEKDDKHLWPKCWYGINGFFKWLESYTYKMHIRVFLSRYRSYMECEACNGSRFTPESLAFKVHNPFEKNAPPVTLSQFYDFELGDALSFIQALQEQHSFKRPIEYALKEVQNRLSFLNQIGLNYLTLNRQTRTLSGGETERVSLTGCLGNRLVNTLYILDEPSVGLHPRDTARLVEAIKQLRDIGNTIITVEHEMMVIEAADHIIDLGPKAGAHGGEAVYQGSYQKFLLSGESRTAGYMSGRLKIPVPSAKKSKPRHFLKIRKACANNLNGLDLDIPLQRFVCISGVSGSGKSTLLRSIIHPGVQQVLDSNHENCSLKIEGENPASASRIHFSPKLITNMFLVDQSPIGKTPRSSPTMYVGAFNDLRQFFIWKLNAAGVNSFLPGHFTYNSKLGQCPRCRGLGFEEIEMQFLSDVYTRCPDCNGTRFNAKAQEASIELRNPLKPDEPLWMTIVDLLALTVDEAISILDQFPDSTHARRASAKLSFIQQTGLGYITLGQPLNTLSGGECQRLKLAARIAESCSTSFNGKEEPFLFLFDEPSTGLHFDDIMVLLQLFSNLVLAGHSVIVIEHNLDILKCADWLIDMGPEGGYLGGHVVAQGHPEEIASNELSQTGVFLKKYCF
jgi:excinuclease ABC subunit A